MSKKHNKPHKEDKSVHIPQRDKIKEDLSIRALKWTPKQLEFIKVALDKNTKMIIADGLPGTAKAQPLDANILTPNGWKKMGDIKCGDFVISVDGNPTQVLGVFPQGVKKVYKIIFSDDTSTECCEDHLWLTQTREDRNHWSRTKGAIRGTKHKTSKPGTVKNTLEIKASLRTGSDNRLNHSIPICSPVNFASKKHLIHPYLLGCLIGDGCLRTNIDFSSADSQIVETIRGFLPENMILKKKQHYDYRIVKTSFWGSFNPIKEEIKRMGLYGKYSYEKHIPSEYLIDGIENRKLLLQGLLDTDGTTTGHETSYTTTSYQLALDVRSLVESLGGVATINFHPNNFYTYKGEKKKGRASYQINIKVGFNPFRLERKYNKYIPKTRYGPIRYITGVEEVGVKECQCILVAHPTHLYLTNNYIVTHNTSLSVYCSLMLMNEKKISDLVYVRSLVQSKDGQTGYLTGSLEEKTQFYNIPLLDKLEEFLPPSQVNQLIKDQRVVCYPTSMLRGYNWAAKSVILDESTNMTFDSLLTATTRLAEHSKLFVLGDIKYQNDLGKLSGFKKFVNIFNTEDCRKNGIFYFSFGKEDIMRSAFCKFVMEKVEEYEFIQDKSSMFPEKS